MLSLFRPRPLLDPASVEWMYDTFEWVLTHFDKDEFFQRTRLIQPTSAFFPGRVNSVHDKAESIFQHTLNYSGLSHWPFAIQAPEHFQNVQPPLLPLQLLGEGHIRRNSSEASLPSVNGELPLYVSYIPDQTRKPEDLSAGYAHIIAKHVLVQSQKLPPGGKDYFNEATEVLAICMGFGVMLANTAYTFKGGCGSCFNPNANRQAALTEDDVVFALALYCRLKNVPDSEAAKYLKKYLKGNFKRALKQIDSEPERLNKLKESAV